MKLSAFGSGRLHNLTQNLNIYTLLAKKLTKIHTLTQNCDEPTIGRTKAEQELLFIKSPEMPENPKLLKMAILGVPNSGKNVLTYSLIFFIY